MFQHEGDGVSIEASIQCVQHRSCHGYSEMAFVHFWSVAQHRSDGVAHANASAHKSRSELPAARVRVLPIKAAPSVDHCGTIREDLGSPGEKGERGQWCEV